MMEQYYETTSNLYYQRGILEDARPEAGYQCGIMPELKERARNHRQTLLGNPTFDMVPNLASETPILIIL